eukprot:7287469-Lingulodinium_polyedra.AAC.1
MADVAQRSVFSKRLRVCSVCRADLARCARDLARRAEDLARGSREIALLADKYDGVESPGRKGLQQ